MQVIQGPSVTTNDINRLENKITNLKGYIQELEQTLKKLSPTNDKLAIFKQQATLVTKKKEAKLQELARVEEERLKL